jgi:ATP synthase protein I
LISVLGTYLLARRVERAGRIAHQNPKKSMQLLYVGAVQRFVLAAALLGCGLVLIKLEPVALLAGLALTQLAYMMAMRGTSRAD